MLSLTTYGNGDKISTGETRYEYVGSSLAYQVTTNVNGAVEQELYFFYDASGNLSVIRQVTPTKDYHFYVTTNGQGDITGIVDESGSIILTYSYTAWGKVTYSATDMESMALAATLSNVNPFTYRGYCYDYDIGMYYLQSRYYDPNICRFINADSTDYLGATGTTLSYNLFAYCENDGVNFVDFYGSYSVTVSPNAVEWGVNGRDDFKYNRKVKATLKDSLNWKVWGCLKGVAKLKYPDGAAFYEYYRSNQGGIYLYDYEKAYKEDQEIKKAVKELVSKLKEKAPKYKPWNNERYCLMTNQISVTPKTFNWKLAIGTHYVGGIAIVEFDKNTSNYIMSYIIIAVDRYNFDKNKEFFGIPDAWNGRFVTLGWAKFFTSLGIMVGARIWELK